MRRQQRIMCNSAAIFAIATAIGDVLYQWHQHKQAGIDFTLKNYNGIRTLRNSFYGGLAGMAAGYSYCQYLLSQEENIPFDADGYLVKLINTENLKSNQALLKSVLSYREKVKSWLTASFGDQLVGKPEDAGSFIKRTANASNHDLDIILPFRKDAYGTLEEMFEHAFETVNKGFGKIATITRQKRAIGLTFNGGTFPIHIDIVPGREINNYITDKELNLFVTAEWIWQKGKSFKINTDVQRNMTTNNPDARKVIRLLKIYRDNNNLSLPSLIIEHSVVRALSKKVYASDCENLLYAMEYLAENLEKNTLVDFANTNNNILQKMNEHERFSVRKLLLADVCAVEKNARYLKEMFE